MHALQIVNILPVLKNDVVLFSQKRFCALGLELGEVSVRNKARVEVRVSGISIKYVFGQTSIRASVQNLGLPFSYTSSYYLTPKQELARVVFAHSAN